MIDYHDLSQREKKALGALCRNLAPTLEAFEKAWDALHPQDQKRLIEEAGCWRGAHFASDLAAVHNVRTTQWPPMMAVAAFEFHREECERIELALSEIAVTLGPSDYHLREMWRSAQAALLKRGHVGVAKGRISDLTREILRIS